VSDKIPTEKFEGRVIVLEEKRNGTWKVSFTEAPGRQLTRRALKTADRALSVAAGQHFRLQARQARTKVEVETPTKETA
jgi:hypothetical protein